MRVAPFLLSCAVFWSLTSLAAADDALKPAQSLPGLNRRIVTFSVQKTQTGYVHVADGASAPKAGAQRAKLPHAEIIAVAGRAPSDLWFLTEDATIIHDDGKRVVERFVKPCGWGEWQRESNGLGTHFYTLAVDNEKVHVFAEFRDSGTRIGGERRASLGKDGKWVCEAQSLVPDLIQSTSATTWRASHNMDGDSCRISSSLGFCTSGPRFAPSHIDPVRDSTDMGIYNVGFFMYGHDDGYTVTLNEGFNSVLYRFNGVSWSPVGAVPSGYRVTGVWADEQRNAWMLARPKGHSDNPTRTIFRYDGKSVQEFASPAAFAATWVMGTGPRDIWFGGDGPDVYQWDGSVWRKGTLPFLPSDAWAAPSGEVYFVSPQGVAHTAPLGETQK